MPKSPKKKLRVSVLRTTCTPTTGKKAGKKSAGKKAEKNKKSVVKKVWPQLSHREATKYVEEGDENEPTYKDNYYRWGLNAVQFKSQAKFKKLLKDYDLTEFEKIPTFNNEDHHEFRWNTHDHSLVISCSVNPITGEYYEFDLPLSNRTSTLKADRPDFKNYAGYMTIEARNRETLLEFVEEIWDSTSYIKEGRNDFI